MMEYNVCPTCGACDGRAGLLINGECSNCHDTRQTGNIVLHGHLCRTETEWARTMSIVNGFVVLVDEPRNGWSHMTAPTVVELHRFAKASGLPKSRFENKRGKSRPHYDVREDELPTVLALGAVPVDRREFVLSIRRWHED